MGRVVSVGEVGGVKAAQEPAALNGEGGRPGGEASGGDPGALEVGPDQRVPGGLNSVFRATKRQARGYRSTTHLITMLCFVAGKLRLTGSSSWETSLPCCASRPNASSVPHRSDERGFAAVCPGAGRRALQILPAARGAATHRTVSSRTHRGPSTWRPELRRHGGRALAQAAGM